MKIQEMLESHKEMGLIIFDGKCFVRNWSSDILAPDLLKEDVLEQKRIPSWLNRIHEIAESSPLIIYNEGSSEIEFTPEEDCAAQVLLLADGTEIIAPDSWN